MGRALDERAEVRMGRDRLVFRETLQIAEAELGDLLDDFGQQSRGGPDGCGGLACALQRAGDEGVRHQPLDLIGNGLRLMVAEIGQKDILPTNQQPVDIGFGLAMADEDQLGCFAIGMMKSCRICVRSGQFARLVAYSQWLLSGHISHRGRRA